MECLCGAYNACPDPDWESYIAKAISYLLMGLNERHVES